MKKIVVVVLALIAVVLALSSCTQAERVSYSISKEADAFNVLRRLTVINARTDKPLLEMIGRFSIANNSDGELVVTVEVGEGMYKKHFVYINEEWTMYVVEDIAGAKVDKYKYEINFLPEMIVPIRFTTSD